MPKVGPLVGEPEPDDGSPSRSAIDSNRPRVVEVGTIWVPAGVGVRIVVESLWRYGFGFSPPRVICFGLGRGGLIHVGLFF